MATNALLPITILKAVQEVVMTIVNKAPEIIRAFKEDGGGRLNKEDARILENLASLQKQQNETNDSIKRLAESQEQLNKTLQMMMMLMLRLEDTSMSSQDHQQARRDISAHIRTLLADSGITPDVMRDFEGGSGASAPTCEDDEKQQHPGLNCGVCTRGYNRAERRPLILTHCGHTFCRACLVKVNREQHFNCPTCRQGKDRFEDLPQNYAVLEILDMEKQEDSERDEENLKGCSAAGGLSYEDELAIAIQMSREEAEADEGKRGRSGLAQDMGDGGRCEERQGAHSEEVEQECREVSPEKDEWPDCQYLGTQEKESCLSEELQTWEEWEMKKEKKRNRRKIKEQEELEMAIALSLSLQEGGDRSSNQ